MSNKVIEFISNNENWLIVDIPEKSYDFKFHKDLSMIWYQLEPLRGFLSIEIPNHSWVIFGKASELTEEQKEEMLICHLIQNRGHTKIQKIYKDYQGGDNDWFSQVYYSFKSLLDFYNIKAETTLILKKEK